MRMGLGDRKMLKEERFEKVVKYDKEYKEDIITLSLIVLISFSLTCLLFAFSNSEDIYSVIKFTFFGIMCLFIFFFIIISLKSRNVYYRRIK